MICLSRTQKNCSHLAPFSPLFFWTVPIRGPSGFSLGGFACSWVTFVCFFWVRLFWVFSPPVFVLVGLFSAPPVFVLLSNLSLPCSILFLKESLVSSLVFIFRPLLLGSEERDFCCIHAMFIAASSLEWCAVSSFFFSPPPRSTPYAPAKTDLTLFGPLPKKEEVQQRYAGSVPFFNWVFAFGGDPLPSPGFSPKSRSFSALIQPTRFLPYIS